jgi:hypothetical protein
MASTRIYRTSGTPTNRKKFTISCWLKKSKLADDMQIVNFYEDASNRTQFSFNSSDQFDFIVKSGNTNTMRLKTTRVFRDPSAWYHIVMTVDTTQATNTDRLKVYINGEQNLSANNGFASETYPSQNADATVGGTHNIGAYDNGGSPTLYWDGLLAHLHYTDGYAYAASDFGETDTTSGIWKPKTAPSVTYGNNGFFLKFENSGNMDLDSSGNNLTFTTSGTLTQNVDTPTNVFANMSSLDNYYTVNTFTNAANTVTTPNSGYSGAIGGMGVSSGKWYFEFKPISKTGDADEYAVGITGAPVTSTNQPHWKLATGYMYGAVNGNVFNNDSGSAYGNTYTAGDIIGVAMDLDNNKLYFSKNGTFQNSGVPTSGSTGTGATSITAASSTPIGFYLPCCAFSSNSYGAVMAFNFGSGYFQTTAVTSANADANGHGAFEYSVPSGYYALCTKNIKEFG